MSWFQQLYKTYENCIKASKKSGFEIAPVAHTHKVCNIEITLNERAEMVEAAVININCEDTIIPTTDDNNCMWALAVDIKNLKKESYRQILKEWIDFDKDNKKLEIISNYVQRDTLIQDLAEKGLLYVDEEFNLIKKSKEHKIPKEIINKYKILQNKNIKQQEDVFIRWVVECEEHCNTYEDEAIKESWINFRKQKENKKYKSEVEKAYRKTDKENDIAVRLIDDKICCISGKTDCIATNHQFANGTSKIIAVGDDLVFKGRFEEYYEALSISFDVSQKAHNTLKWLIADERKQAYRNYPQIIVAFTIEGKNGNIGEVFGKDFVKSVKGYDIKFEQFEENENIVVLEMDAASKGRACITYYREMTSSQYLENIKNWHKKYYWQQFLKIKNKDNQKEEYRYFYGTPSINAIATIYFYKKDRYLVEKNEQKIKSKLIRDLMPSVLENRNIPEYIERHFIEKASNPIALNDIQWKTILRIACSIYKGNHLYYDENKKEEDYLMSVDENCKDRNYLYGRLLAVIDDAEKSALLKQNKENSNTKEAIRSTNAQRLMRQFSIKPFETWKVLYEKFNDAYKRRVNGYWIDKRIVDIKDKFTSIEEFKNNSKLTGLYLLGYFHQLKTIEDERKNKKAKELTNDNIEQKN
ncbi:MAG: type I-C CRISPR-associated protein Cas8c/Csd1 [Endomicrobium sp.]|jgi:CRISPR-associated protein Csd1|nr:type I-C CRISPR-associated protein Cas8c/Csd1 [Endomicrobium sp.]